MTTDDADLHTDDPGEDDGPLPIVDDDVAEAVPPEGDGEVIVPPDEADELDADSEGDEP